jgi:hypothetical protein
MYAVIAVVPELVSRLILLHAAQNSLSVLSRAARRPSAGRPAMKDSESIMLLCTCCLQYSADTSPPCPSNTAKKLRDMLAGRLPARLNSGCGRRVARSSISGRIPCMEKWPEVMPT